MALNVIFNDINYQLLPKQREQFDKYCRILQWGRQHPTRFAEQFLNLQLTDMQKWVLLSSWVPATVVWCMSRSTGKACCLNTRVYPVIRDREGRNGKVYNNPKTVGELQVGDLIYDSDGQPTEVLHLNPIILDDEYKIYFEDGEVISCNAEHQWLVNDREYTKNDRKNNRPQFVIRNTDFIYNKYLRSTGKKENAHDYRFHVPLNKPIQYPKVSLYGRRTISPYLLGVWLGDGSSNAPIIASGGKDVDEMMENLRPYVSIIEKVKEENKDCYIIKIDMLSQFERENGGFKDGFEKLNFQKKTLRQKLNNLGVLNNKEIPLQYLYAPIEDRLELLQGLMDTDGTIDKNGWCEFTQTNKKLFDQVHQLVTSLGIMATPTYKEHTGYIKKNGEEADTWRLQFIVPKSMPIFKLKRKLDRQREDVPRGTQTKAIIKVERTGKKIPMRCITVSNETGLFLCGEHMTVTHNSYLASIFVMLRALLFPHYHSYIMGPTGQQSQETFTKLENIAKNNIASAIGITSVFIDECMRMNSKADPFTHNAQGYEVKLYNGSSVHSLNSVAKNIVGIRSNFNLYDEAGKIEPDFYALTQPFTVQDTNFVTGYGIQTELFPKQLQNKTLYSSSAEGIDSTLFKQYKLAFQRMLLGDPDYFVADIDCNFSLHPYMNGKPAPPQLSQKTIDDAMETNPFRARREYFNIFDNDSSDDVFVKRSIINKYSQAYFPVFENENGKKKYIIAYDPATKLDNSIVLVGELIRDKERGLMIKLVHCANLIEILKNGEKAIIQAPEQIEILKNTILSYNKGVVDYKNVVKLCIDAGAGGFLHIKYS